MKAEETKEFLVTQCLTAGSGHSLQKQDLSLETKMLSQQSPSADWSPVMDGGRNPALSSNACTTALGSAWRATPAARPAPSPPQASCHLLLPSRLSALSLLSDLEHNREALVAGLSWQQLVLCQCQRFHGTGSAQCHAQDSLA